MSSQSYSTFQSSTYSSGSDSSGNTYIQTTASDPSGTTIKETSQRAGQPPISHVTNLPARGAAAQPVKGLGSERRIEDVSDRDQTYEEKMKDEYAKREGGA